MSRPELLSSPMADSFRHFIERLETTAVICSPYVSMGPSLQLIDVVNRKGIQASLNLCVVTDLSPATVLQGATDVNSLIALSSNISRLDLIYLPRVHAKVYISGDDLAIVGSANFTDGGLFRNLEYGVIFRDRPTVQQIDRDIKGYAVLGGKVNTAQLAILKQHVERFRDTMAAMRRSVNEGAAAAALEIQRETEDDLIRIRVNGKSAHGIFCETILYLLNHDSLTTVQLHSRIHDIHPDLCDDTMDRVIDGKHYGKLWKHQVRNAQQYLKRNGLIAYDEGRRAWEI